MQIREGRVVGQGSQLVDGVSGVGAAEIVNELTKLHYQKTPDAPREVLLPVDIEDAQTVAELLAERRGASSRVFAPQRGEKRDLVAMAMENAEQHLRTVLERESAGRRRGEEAIADLQRVLSLPVAPRRIEAFDISNVSGTQAVGSMIVFQDGQPKKSEYRRFRIRLSEGEPNDYEMMREVLARRLQAAVSGNVRFERLPDLLLLDGGRGQLGVAMKAMGELDLMVPAAGLAKEHEHVYLPERVNPVSLPAHSRSLHLLQRVRDEAHRFALSYHRSLRARRARESALDEVLGVGPVRKQRLLKHFKGLGKLRAASVEEIADVARCPRDVAEAVVEHLRETGAD
jgi:excinuclease ABC subunit C